MKAIILFNIIKRVAGIIGIVLCCSLPAHAGKPKKAVDKPKAPVDLILTMPDQWLAEKNASPSVNLNMAAQNNDNQAFTSKKAPVKVKCDVDVIQNTLSEVPLSNRLFGECDLHYRY
ncbi:MAG: hypothetical protein ACXV8O_00085 [Methylobacter sp.]